MNAFVEHTGYLPGLIGRVAELHACYYSRDWNFGRYFEAKVATDLSLFIRNYDEAVDCIWSLTVNDRIEASIAIDGSSDRSRGESHLRWFIVSDSLRGKGAGNYLMDKAMSFCKRKAFKKTYLWTFKGLESARHIYEKHGFSLVNEFEGDQWGTIVVEQRFEAELCTDAMGRTLQQG